MIVALVTLFHVMGFTSSIHAVMSTRTSQGAIAWAVSLNTFPYLAVPAYWVLGRSKFQGYVVARRNTDGRNDRIEQQAIETVAPFRVGEADRVEAARAAEGLVGHVPVDDLLAPADLRAVARTGVVPIGGRDGDQKSQYDADDQAHAFCPHGAT